MSERTRGASGFYGGVCVCVCVHVLFLFFSLGVSEADHPWNPPWAFSLSKANQEGREGQE